MGAGGHFFLSLGPGVFGLLGMSRGRENVVLLTTLSKSHNDVRILQQIFGQVRSMKK